MPVSPSRRYGLTGLQPAQSDPVPSRLPVRFLPNLQLLKGTVVGEVTSVFAVQVIELKNFPNGGTFTLTFGANTTGTIPWNGTAAQVQAALVAITPPGAGGVTVTGGPGGTAPWVVTFASGNTGPQSLITGNGAGLTGGINPGVVVTQTVAGSTSASGYFRDYASGHSDGSQTAKGVLEYDIFVDYAGDIQFGQQDGGSIVGEKFKSAPIFTRGVFNCSDLIGLDATAASQIGRLLQGTVTSGLMLLGG